MQNIVKSDISNVAKIPVELRTQAAAGSSQRRALNIEFSMQNYVGKHSDIGMCKIMWANIMWV